MSDVIHRLRQLVAAGDPNGTVTLAWLAELLEESGAPASASVDFSVEQVAELLDRSPSTIRGWIGDGAFPSAYRLRGREWRVPKGDVEELQRREAERYQVSKTGNSAPARAKRETTASTADWRDHLPGK